MPEEMIETTYYANHKDHVKGVRRFFNNNEVKSWGVTYTEGEMPDWTAASYRVPELKFCVTVPAKYRGRLQEKWSNTTWG